MTRGSGRLGGRPLKTGNPQTSLNFCACGSSPLIQPHKELVTPRTSTLREQTGVEPSLTGAFHPRKKGTWLSLICCRTHSTTSRRAQEPREELVTYCLATNQSEVTVQHRLGSLGFIMEETDDTPTPNPHLHPHGPGTAAEVTGSH